MKQKKRNINHISCYRPKYLQLNLTLLILYYLLSVIWRYNFLWDFCSSDMYTSGPIYGKSHFLHKLKTKTEK